MLWNQAVHTDREVTANRPDIIIKNKKEKICTLIDVVIPADRNVVQKEAEKKLKYESLCIEIQRMWNLKCTIVPVIIGATGVVTRSLNALYIPVSCQSPCGLLLAVRKYRFLVYVRTRSASSFSPC